MTGIFRTSLSSDDGALPAFEWLCRYEPTPYDDVCWTLTGQRRLSGTFVLVCDPIVLCVRCRGSIHRDSDWLAAMSRTCRSCVAQLVQERAECAAHAARPIALAVLLHPAVLFAVTACLFLTAAARQRDDDLRLVVTAFSALYLAAAVWAAVAPRGRRIATSAMEVFAKRTRATEQLQVGAYFGVPAGLLVAVGGVSCVTVIGLLILPVSLLGILSAVANRVLGDKGERKRLLCPATRRELHLDDVLLSETPFECRHCDSIHRAGEIIEA
jgi:hypothetical protein